MKIAIEIDAKKQVLATEEVWERLSRAEKIFVAKGQKVQVYVPDQTVKELLLQNVLGRTGNLRAPALQVGNIYYVGYNEKMYEELTA